MPQSFEKISEKLIKEVFSPDVEAPELGTYRPTLVLGLGGTGTMVLRHLKKMFQEHKEVDLRMLAIDCDRNLDNLYDEDILPRLRDDLILLNPQEAVSLLANARRGEGSVAFVNEFLPQRVSNDGRDFHLTVQQKIQDGDGAGMFRRAGRLIFNANVDHGRRLRRVFEGIRSDLTSLSERVAVARSDRKFFSGVRVLVVTSLAGGAGSGSVIEALGLLRSVFSGDQDRISLYSVLPGLCFDEKLDNTQRPHTYGGCIGALREIDAFLSGKMAGYEFHWGGGSFKLEGPLANEVYLIGHTSTSTEGVSPITELDDIFQSISLYLYSITGTGVGMTQDQERVNDYKQPQADLSQTIQYRFCSLGASAAVLPREEISRYAIHRAARDLLTEWQQSDRMPNFQAHLSQLGLNDYETFINNFHGFSGSLKFHGKQMGGAYKTWMKSSDGTFLAEAQSRINGFSRILDTRENPVFDEEMDALNEKVQGLYYYAHNSAAISKASLETYLSVLNGMIEGLENAIADPANIYSIPGNQAELDKNSQKLEELAREINNRKWDGKYRKDYHVQLNRRMEHLFEQRRINRANQAIHYLRQSVDYLKGQYEFLVKEAERQVWTSDHFCRSYDQRDDVKTITQYVIPPSEFAAWLDMNAVTPGPISQAVDLTPFGLVQSSLAGLVAQLGRILSGFDVINYLEQAGGLKPVLEGLSVAASPLFSYTQARPANLLESNFVAGADLEGDENEDRRGVIASASIQQDLKYVSGASGRCLIRSHSSKGIELHHWRNFTYAQERYSEDPFYYGTIERSWEQKLPSVVQVTAGERDLYRDFCWAWILDIIREVDGAFYLNAEPLQDSRGQLQQSVYSKDRNELVQALIDSDLLVEAPASELLIDSGDLLAGTLESAIEVFKGPEFDDEREIIHQWLTGLSNKLGRESMDQKARVWFEEKLKDLKCDQIMRQSLLESFRRL